MARFAAILIGLVGITAVGCGRSPAPIPAMPAASKSPPPAASTPAKDTAATTPPVAAKPSEQEPEKPSETVADDNAGACERLAILTLGGPLLVDVSVTLDGRPHNAVFDEQVKQVLEAADTDKDGRPTWKELATNENYLADGQPNRPPISR